jgi:hypothetical protein
MGLTQDMSGLLELYAEIIFLLAYLAAIIYSAIYFCPVLGIWTWALIGIELAPEIIVAVHVNDVREKIHIEGLMQSYSNVDIEQKIIDYVQDQKKSQ